MSTETPTETPTKVPTQRVVQQKPVKHRTFTGAELKWWVDHKYKNVGKFVGVEHKEGKFYFAGKEIIPREQQEQRIKELYEDPKTGLNSLQKFNSYMQTHCAGVSRANVSRVLNKLAVYSASNQLETP